MDQLVKQRRFCVRSPAVVVSVSVSVAAGIAWGELEPRWVWHGS